MENFEPSCKKVKLSLFAIIWMFSFIGLISTSSYAQTISLSEIETWKKLIEGTKFEDMTKKAGSIVNMWNVVTDKATGVPLIETYKKLYNDAQNQLSTARNLIGQSKAHYDRREFDQAKNDLLNAQKYLKVAQSTNQNAIQVWEGLLDSGNILAKGLQQASDFALSSLASLVPGASSVVTGFLTSRDFIADTAMNSLGEASKNAITNIAITVVFKQFTEGKPVKGLGEIDMTTLAKRLSSDPNFRGRVENLVLQDLLKQIPKDQATKITRNVLDQFSIYVAKLPNQSTAPSKSSPAPTPSPQPQQDVSRLNGIKQAFRDILGRDADTGGLNGYYNSGLSIESIRQSLLNSNECHQGKGGECARRYASANPQPSPSPQPIHLSEGTLCRLKGQNQVYVISGGRKCYIPDPETFNARGFKWNQILEIDQVTFNSIPTGSALPSVKTTVVQTPSPTPSPQPQQDPTRLNDIKQAYRDILGRDADAGGLNGYYNSGLGINSIRQSLLNSNECRQGKGGECAKRYGSGSSQPSPTPQTVHLSEGNLIRLKGQNQVFVISGGRKCHIPDPETFNARGFKWDQIKEVDQNTFNSVPTGNTLASVKQSVAQTPSQSQPDVNRINDIKQAYRDILGRDADTSGLTGYYNGGQSIGAIRQSLLNSNECHQGKGGECAKRYGSGSSQPSPTPQTVHLSEGNLIRLKGQNQVFVISGGRKCHIPDPETFNARGFKWDQIKEVDQNTFNSVPTGNTLASVKQSVAQTPSQSQPDINRINDIKQAYRDILGRDADTSGLTGYYNGGQSIGAIRQSLLNSNECHQGKGGECARLYGSGSSQPSPTPQTVHLSEGNLIRLKGQNQVYVISGGKKCYIPDPETFNARGFNWNQIKEIDQATYNSVPTGPALASVKTTVAQPSASTPSPQPQQIDTNRLNAIKQVYRDVLGREADTGGLTGYYNGGQSIGAIRQSLLNSNECHQGKGGECARLYATSKSQPPSSPQPIRLGEGSLIRLQGKQEVFVISGGRKCYIPDPETLYARGFKPNQIKDIDQNTFNSIPAGNPLASVKQTASSPQTNRVNPQIGISTKSSGFGDSNASGKQGDAFYTHGKGFSPNSTISYHVKKPDGSEFPPSDYRTNGSGEFSNTYNSHCGSLVGTYHIWVVDKATGKGSNTVTEKMAKSSKCK